MIATNDCIYVDECDPLFDAIQPFTSWEEVKRHVGRNLNRMLCGSYIVVVDEADFPDYTIIRGEIAEACRRLNADHRVSLPDINRGLDAGSGRVLPEVPGGEPAASAAADKAHGRRKRVRRVCKG